MATPLVLLLLMQCQIAYWIFFPQQSSIVKNMKAIRVHKFGGPEVLEYETNVPIPKLESNSVLIRVKAVGINPVDTYVRSGSYARKPKLPYTPGHDCAGVVEEVSPEVTTFRKGDRVYAGSALSGSYAEYALVSAHNVQPLPSDVSFEQGAAIPVPYYTAYRGLIIRAKAKPGETVLVHGASGGVGIAAVQIASSYGMKVIGTASTLDGMEAVKRAGACGVYNHREEGYMDGVKSSMEQQGGFDVIIENASHINLGKDLTVLAKGGRVAVVGSRGQVEVNPRDAMSREACILGVMLFQATEEESQETMAAVQGGLGAGWLRPIVGREFPLEEVAQAHREIMESAAQGKMVLTVS